MDDEIKLDDLPALSPKQIKFVMNISVRPDEPSKAYKNSYDCENMSAESISVEAYRLLHNPKITQWIDYYRKNAKQQIEEEFKYTAIESFQKFNEIQELAMLPNEKGNYTNLSAAAKCEEMKGRLFGAYEQDNNQKTAPELKINVINEKSKTDYEVEE